MDDITDGTELPKVTRNIKLAMKIANISEAKLAKATHLSQATLNQILRGATKAPRVDTLQLIATELGVTISQLMDEESLPIVDKKVVTPHYAPVIEWDEAIDFAADVNYSCMDKKKIAINVDNDGHRGHHFALKASPSMEPQFRRGSYMIVEPTKVFKDHQIVVVSFDGNEPTLRRIVKDGSTLYLQHLNPEPGDRKTKVGDSDNLLGRVISEIRFEEDFN